MDLFAFVASLASSLAWPLTIAVALVVFRSELRALLARPLEYMKGPGGFEARFLPQVQDDAAVSAALADSPGTATVIGEALDATADSRLSETTRERATRPTYTVGSAGDLRRGQVSQVAGSISVVMDHALDHRRAHIRVTLDTAGVAFVGSPNLLTSRGLLGMLRFEEPRTAFVVELTGPTETPLSVFVMNLRIAVAQNAPLGVVRMSVSVDGSAPQQLASIGTIVPAEPSP